MILVLLYVIGFISTGLIVIRYEFDNARPIDVDDQILIGVQGFLAGLVWPVILIGYALYRIATHNSTKGK